MKILLDSHILLWALTDHPKLPGKARDYIQDPENLIFYSAVSVWELSLKHTAHPDNVEFSGRELCEYCDDAEYLPLNVTRSHILTMERLRRKKDAPPHKDPFDKLLLAQAVAENMLFLTHDSLLPDYGEPCVVYL